MTWTHGLPASAIQHDMPVRHRASAAEKEKLPRCVGRRGTCSWVAMGLGYCCSGERTRPWGCASAGAAPGSASRGCDIADWRVARAGCWTGGGAAAAAGSRWAAACGSGAAPCGGGCSCSGSGDACCTGFGLGLCIEQLHATVG